MKKLMIAAAIVCAAVVSQAATLDWSIAKKGFLMSDGSTKPDGTTVYLLNAGDATGMTALQTALTGGKYATLSALIAGDEFTAVQLGDPATTIGSAGTSGFSTKYGNLTASVDDLIEKKTYTGAFFVTDGDMFLISNTRDGVAYVDSADKSELSFTTSDYKNGWTSKLEGNKNGWAKYTAAPEPTSGLLLLLGMAGLALRRRRA